MAIQYEERITILVKKDVKARYKAICEAEDVYMTDALRPQVDAFIAAWEAKQTAPVQPT